MPTRIGREEGWGFWNPPLCFPQQSRKFHLQLHPTEGMERGLAQCGLHPDPCALVQNSHPCYPSSSTFFFFFCCALGFAGS